MQRFAGNSNDTASLTDIKSCEDGDLFDLERDIPTTENDIQMLRQLGRQPGPSLLPSIDKLLDSAQFDNIAPRRTTSEGWEPFEL